MPGWSPMQPPVTACIPAEWMFHRHPHGELTEDDTEPAPQRKLFYKKGPTRGEVQLKAKGVNRGHKAAASSANIAVRRREGSQDHYLQGLKFLFWHAQRYIPQKGIVETWGQWWRLEWLSTSILCTVTWAYTQSLMQNTDKSSICCLLSVLYFIDTL